MAAKQPVLALLQDPSFVDAPVASALERLGYAILPIARSQLPEVVAARHAELVVLAVDEDTLDALHLPDPSEPPWPLLFVLREFGEGRFIRLLAKRPLGFLLPPFDDKHLRTVVESARIQCRQQRAQARWLERYRRWWLEVQESWHLTRAGRWRWEVREDRLVWSDELFAMLGISSRPARIDMAWTLQWLHPEDRARFEARIRDLLEKHEPLYCEHRIITADGRVKHAECRAEIAPGSREPDLRVFGTIQDISQRKQAEQQRDQLTRRLQIIVAELRQQVALMARAEAVAKLGYWTVDLKTRQVFWSEGAFQLLGLEPGAVETGFGAFLEYIHPEDRRRVEQSIKEAVEGKSTLYETEYRAVRTDGEERVFHAQGQVERGDEGEPLRFFGVTQDVTETKRLELMLRERFRLMAEVIEDVVWVSLPETMAMVYANPAYERIWGRSRQSLYTHPESFMESIHPEDQERITQTIAAHREGEWDVEYRIVRPDGTIRWIHDRGFGIRDERGRLSFIVGVAADITRLKETELALKGTVKQLEKANRKLKRLTFQDELTGLTNRRYLEKTVQQEWRRERRHCHNVALLMADIDNFKDYNDAYGHPQGDQCLRRVASQFSNRLRRPSDTVARIGGEEFAILLPETDLDNARRLAEEMRRSVVDLNIPHSASSVAPVVTVSLGVASVNACEASFDDLMHLADIALYQAKAEGRNRVGVVGPQASE